MTAESPVVARALGYPYDLPDRSYVFDTAGERPWTDADRHLLVNRVPVLACGSNQAPSQLERKFPPPARGSGSAVIRCELDHYDAVYSAHFSSYGAIAATLAPSLGTTVSLFVTYLDPGQLQIMHDSEAVGKNYGFGLLENIHMRLETGPVLEHAAAYVGLRGGFERRGWPVPLAAVPATNRRFPALTQTEIQAVARNRLSSDLDLGAFIHQNATDAAIRRHRIAALLQTAVPLSLPAFTQTLPS